MLTEEGPESILTNLIQDGRPESIGDGAQEEISSTNMETEPGMDIKATWRPDVDDYLVPPPHPQQTFPDNLPPSVRAPSSIFGNNHVDNYLVPPPHSKTFFNNQPTTVLATYIINAEGVVVQVDPNPPARSKSVIQPVPGPRPRLTTTQAYCRPAIHTSVRSPRAKKIAKTNLERCRDYRKRQKTKKENEEEELRMLDAKNKVLKDKETAIRNKVQRMREALRRMGLGNYVY